MTAFVIISGVFAPLAAIIALKNEMLPNLKKVLYPLNWQDILTYIHFPITFIALHLWRNELGLSELLWRYLLLGFGYIIATHDFRYKVVPNGYILAFLAVWVIITVPQMFSQIEPALEYLSNAAFGALIGGGLFMLVYIISKKGLGGGDVKFMTVAGLYLGLNGVLPVILYASVLSALTGLVLILFKRMSRKDAMPLVPFLYIGFLITVFVM